MEVKDEIPFRYVHTEIQTRVVVICVLQHATARPPWAWLVCMWVSLSKLCLAMRCSLDPGPGTVHVDYVHLATFRDTCHTEHNSRTGTNRIRNLTWMFAARCSNRSANSPFPLYYFISNINHNITLHNSYIAFPDLLTSTKNVLDV